ncbi:hypothetical protein [Nocardia transvalensis]|uniref:hypothetical protein n=1 Tax=Nocardia transvalensis TaxID=37333 RepID=UPI001894411B|nr:hypothetical protein [Nocardia transvalensis]MBF6333119.1 hypothetical protein [Nocardia transvalensis]
MRIEVGFVHPETGVDHQLRKEYLFWELRGRTAQALHARFPEGASVPMLVRGRSVALDLPERPVWTDIW